MSDNKNITLELTIREAKILKQVIASCIPNKDDEMISMMLYARIAKKIEEKTGQNESL